MKYRGFKESYLHAAFKELLGLGLNPFQAYPVLNLAGVKWRATQIRESRNDETHDRGVAIALRNVTVAYMQAAMRENQNLVKLCHVAEFDRSMLLAMGIAFRETATVKSQIVGPWLRSGDVERRKAVLAFAMGTNLVVDDAVLDPLIRRIVEARYRGETDLGDSPVESLIALVDRLGGAGYAVMNPVADIR